MFARTYAAVWAYAARRAPAAVAQDVVAETFLVAWRRLDDAPADALPWLLAIARRQLANQRRGEHRRGALLARMRALEPRWTPPASAELDPALFEALARLPGHEREALLLTAWDGLDARAAAVVAGCSPAAFRVRLHRARRRIGRELRRREEPDLRGLAEETT
jgi:RNA polymerase sigma factor (sigma-70 family)